MPARLVQRIHFEDFGGTEFERLVFAYHVRACWSDLAWYGQTGSDQGRDIVGNAPVESGFQNTIVQCVNRKHLTQKKAEDDMTNAVSALGSINAFKFVASGTVSAERRDAITKAAQLRGITQLTIWSGVELEEHLRLIGQDLLRRFCNGEEFPDHPDELRKFADDFIGLTDQDMLAQIAAAFERPAFQTPFHEESCLPAFQQAIEDTIAAINTGIWRARDGEIIRRIPSMHHLRDGALKAKVSRAAFLVDKLRRAFVAGLRDKTIRPCGCGDPKCPVFMLDRRTARSMDDIRREALEAFRAAYPSFGIRL